MKLSTRLFQYNLEMQRILVLIAVCGLFVDAGPPVRPGNKDVEESIPDNTKLEREPEFNEERLPRSFNDQKDNNKRPTEVVAIEVVPE